MAADRRERGGANTRLLYACLFERVAVNTDNALKLTLRIEYKHHIASKSVTTHTGRVALQFSGQGATFLEELTEVFSVSPLARTLIEQTCPIFQTLTTTELSDTGFYHYGVDVLRWIKQPSSAPPAEYLAGTPISMPLIGLAQPVTLLFLAPSAYRM